MSASIDNMLAYSRMGRAITTTPAKSNAAVRQAPASTTTFTAGRRVFVERMPEAQRAQVGQLMPVCDKIYQQAMSLAALNGRADLADLASSSAFYLEMSRSIYWRGQPGAPPEPQPAHFRSLRERLKAGYLAQGTFAGTSDADKQLSHDALVFSACMPLLQFQDASKKNDDASRQAARAAAAKLLAKFGLSPTSFQYGADGSVQITPQKAL